MKRRRSSTSTSMAWSKNRTVWWGPSATHQTNDCWDVSIRDRNISDGHLALRNLLKRHLRDQEDILRVVESEIIDLDFHLIQARSALHVLIGALGIQFPPLPSPPTPSNSSDSSDSSSLSPPNSVSQRCKTTQSWEARAYKKGGEDHWKKDYLVVMGRSGPLAAGQQQMISTRERYHNRMQTPASEEYNWSGKDYHGWRKARTITSVNSQHVQEQY